jgi:hypothetical protein
MFWQAEPAMTLFTGSSKVAEKLALDLKGRIKLEDAGFDWKILGPDVQNVRKLSPSSFLCLYACASLLMQTFEYYIGPQDMEGIKEHTASS